MMTEEYTLKIDKDMLDLIRLGLDRMEEERNAEPGSNRAVDLAEEINDIEERIGWMVLYEMKNLPF